MGVSRADPWGVQGIINKLRLYFHSGFIRNLNGGGGVSIRNRKNLCICIYFYSGGENFLGGCKSKSRNPGSAPMYGHIYINICILYFAGFSVEFL